jgi:hypothetical protein
VYHSLVKEKLCVQWQLISYLKSIISLGKNIEASLPSQKVNPIHPL